MTDGLLRVNTFEVAARHLCAWLEGPPMDPLHGMNTAIKLLSNIYSEAAQLQAIADEPPEITAPTVCEEHLESMQTRFEKFPLKRFELNTPFFPEDKNSIYNIFSTFSLIHQFIKTGLDYYDQGERDLAQNYWQQGFEKHWGKMLAGFIYALHSYAEHLLENN